ncbi:MAG TPA: M23 family metallopeptidase, partial [Novosphingobium sp.]|nr:M23 family metallopeptidase [Novosphingobium sp.]
MRRAAVLAPLSLLLMAASEPLPPNQATEHVVQPGETLGGVANRAEVPRVLIIEANGLKPPYHLRAGQRLKIPRTRHHNVIAGETGFTIAYSYGVPWREIAVANGIEPDAPIRAGQRLLIPTILTPPAAPPATTPQAAAQAAAQAPRFAWPIPPGTVRRGFTARGKANYHDGIDLPVPVGQAVRAAAAGRVIFAGSEPRQFGNLVVVEHADGWQSAYAFLSRITVKEGDEVRQGERVGLSGRTGMARGPELHFELRQNNRAVDPLAHLPERRIGKPPHP